MASTTKVWALDLTAHALEQGWVDLDDQITITDDEADVGGSSMNDVNGVVLEEGEIVKLRDLIRGMMYPSGNNATYAIADHVAKAYYGPNADWHDYTTARELAEEFQHVLQLPFVAQVLGFNGTWVATTQGPNGMKTYKFTNGNSYVGWEGEKNGISPNCNGALQGCIVRAATRIGRRLVVATMQGTRGAEENAMLDYGFAGTFAPVVRGQSAPAGAVSRQSLDCFGSAGAVTAALTPSGAINIAQWQAQLDSSSVAKVREASIPAPVARGGVKPSDVAVVHLGTGDTIVATRRVSDITLARWATARSGGYQLLTTDIAAGVGTSMALQPVANDMFITAATTPDAFHTLVIKSWRLQGSGLVNLDTYTDYGYQYTQVAVAGPQLADIFTGHRAVTASLDTYGRIVVQPWGVDATTGAVWPLTAYATTTGQANVSITNFTPASLPDDTQAAQYYAVGYLKPPVGLGMDVYRLDETGTPVFEGTTFTKGAFLGDRIKLAALGTGGVLAAVVDSANHTRLDAWDMHRNANDFVVQTKIATNDLWDGTSLNVCRLSSVHAEGDYVAASADLDGQLHVRAYRSGERPY